MYDHDARQVKLLDFGIATDTQASGDERLTRAGFFVGTLMYIAPEALSGEIVTAAADQYSLATIAYYLLTRCLPYTREGAHEKCSPSSSPCLRFRSRMHERKWVHAGTRRSCDARALARSGRSAIRASMEFADAFKEAARVAESPKMLGQVQGPT